MRAEDLLATSKKKTVAKKDYGTRADKGGAIDPYLAKLKGPVREIANALVALVEKNVKGASAEIKWGMPVFSHHGLLCYLRAYPKYVRFGFYQSEGLDDPKGLLSGSGQGGHLRLESAAQIDAKQIATWLRAAAAHNAAS